MKYEAAARRTCEAIKALAEKPENLCNLESYLTSHFDYWLKRYCDTPEGLTLELENFANMTFN